MGLADWVNNTYFHYKPKGTGYNDVYWIESHGSYEYLWDIADELTKLGVKFSMFPDTRWNLRVKDKASIRKLLMLKGVNRYKEKEIIKRMDII